MTGAGGDSGGSGGGGQQRRRGGGRRRRHQVWVPWPDGLEGGWMNQQQQNCEVGGGGGQALEVLQLRAREAGKALPADPFSVHEAIRLALGEEGGRLASARPESVSGTSYTLVATVAQKELLAKKLAKIGEVEVLVEEHSTRNQVRCVVRCPEVNGVPTDRLKRELADQGVTEIYRHKRQHQQQQDQQDHQQQQQQQEEQYTGTMVITVRGTRQPSYIRFGMLRVPARPYQERPMQCTVCLRFGHKAATCPEKDEGPICGRCSGRHTAEEQQRGPCQRPPHCRRCGKGSRHELRSAQCPVMLREREIARVRGEITGGASFAEAQRALELAKRQQQQQQQQQKITSSTINNSSSSQNRSTPSYAQMAANGLGGGGNSSSSSSNSSNNTSSSSNAANTSNGNQPQQQQQQHKGHQCVGGETLARLEAVVERQATQIATLTANMQTMLQANQNLTKAVQEANSRLAHVQRQYELLLLQQQQQQQQDQDQTPQQDQDQLGELLQQQQQQQQQQSNRPTKQKLERLGSGVTTSSKKKRKESKSSDGTSLPPPPPPPPPPPSPPLPLRKPWGEVMDEELQQTQIICLPDSNDEDDQNQNQNENDQDGYDSDRSEGAQTSEDEDDVAKNNKP